MTDAPKVIEADSITCGPCDMCPAIHINFLDENGEVFATASLPVQNWVPFMERFRGAMVEIGKRHSAPVMKQ